MRKRGSESFIAGGWGYVDRQNNAVGQSEKPWRSPTPPPVFFGPAILANSLGKIRDSEDPVFEELRPGRGATIRRDHAGQFNLAFTTGERKNIACPRPQIYDNGDNQGHVPP